MLRELDNYIERLEAEEKGDLINGINEAYYIAQKALENATEKNRKRLFELVLVNLLENFEAEEVTEIATDIFTIFLY